MNAAIVSSFTTPPAYGHFEDPIARPGEKLVTVTAAALHQIVKALANGSHYTSLGQLPFVAGVDGVGRLEDGQRVYFGGSRPPFGTFAELALTGGFMCLPLPGALDDVTAAGLANPAMSSWVALEQRARFVAGESVFVLGATGVSGQLAVQVAKRLGAKRVIAAGRNAEALAKLKALGADQVISLEQEPAALVAGMRAALDGTGPDSAAAGIDVVLDYLWGSPAERLLEAIAVKGLHSATRRVRYVQIGQMAGKSIALEAATLRSTGLEMLGSGFGSASMDQIRIALAALFQSAADHPFVFSTRTAPLSDVGALWNTAERGARLVFEP